MEKSVSCDVTTVKKSYKNRSRSLSSKALVDLLRETELHSSPSEGESPTTKQNHHRQVSDHGPNSNPSDRSRGSNSNAIRRFSEIGRSFSFYKRKSSSEGSVASSIDVDQATGIDSSNSSASSNLTEKLFNDPVPQSSLKTFAVTTDNGKISNYSKFGGDTCSDANNGDSRGGVFYPPPSDEGVLEQHWNSRTGPPISASEMDDFDFDPLNSNERDDSNMSRDNKNPRERVGFPTRSSFLSFSKFRGETCSNPNNGDSRGGLFYPPPIGEGALEQHWKSRTGPSNSASEMDDFDLDPLNSNERDDSNMSRDNKNPRERGGFPTRPSILSFANFQGRGHQDDDDVASVQTSSTQESGEHTEVATLESLILENDNKIEHLIELTQAQVKDIQNCEATTSQTTIRCKDNEKQFQTNESELRQHVKELEQINNDIKSKLDDLAVSEQKVKEEEKASNEKLANLQEEEVCEINSELKICQRKYNNSQENAISSLSNLLNEVEKMGIPSLRGEMEDKACVCGDIIARFDELTDREEELVQVLCDTDRLTSCQASFEQIQKHIETARGCHNQLGNLKVGLRSYLAKITMLIEQDDEGTHTTESSTASERLSLERGFVEAIMLQISSVKQSQVLDALFNSIHLLADWQEWLLPNCDSDMAIPRSRSTSDGLGNGASTIAMLGGVFQEASVELAAVKSDIIEEQAKYQTKMQNVLDQSSVTNNDQNGGHNACGTSQEIPVFGVERKLDPCHLNNDIIDRSTVKNALDESNPRHHVDEEWQIRKIEVDDLTKQISQEISVAERLLHKQEPMLNRYASAFYPMQPRLRNNQTTFELEMENEKEQLEEFDKQISSLKSSVSDKESLINEYSMQLSSMQTQAAQDSKANLRVLNWTEKKVKHLLVKLEDKDLLIASLKSG